MSRAMELDALRASWDTPPPSCEATTKSGNCQRRAHWLLNIHGCERVMLCGQHLRAWEDKARATMCPDCANCGRAWPTLAEAYTISRI